MSREVLWYVDRGAGLVTLMLLTTGVVLGIVTAMRVRSSIWPRFAMTQLHRNVALLALVFGVVHAGSSVVDTYVNITPLDAIVPFESAYKPFWLGVGAISADLMLAVLITTALRKRLGTRTWRSVHLLSYACWTGAVLHSLALGSDTRTEVSGVMVLAACVGATSAAVVQRRQTLARP
jgi:sulfoxide reductase heme-binding subunit YedZ